MKPVKTANTNHNFGAPVGLEEQIGDLPCQMIDEPVEGDATAVQTTIRSVWKLSDEERAAIAAGGNVELDVGWIGGFPPVALNVTDEQELAA